LDILVQRGSQVTKKIFWIIGLLFIFGGMFYLIEEVNQVLFKSEYNSNVKKKPVNKKTLDTVLLESTGLNVKRELKADQINIVANEDKILNKYQFKGAYIGIENDDIAFSNGFGYSNANTQSVFNMNSTFLVGEYKAFLNNAMFVRLIQEKRINLDDSVQKYLPQLNSNVDITVGQLLKNNKGLYVPKNVFLKKDILKMTQVGENRQKGFQNVSLEVKQILLTNILKEKYLAALENKLILPLELSDTRLYVKQNKQANDVVGYKYVRKNKMLIQRDTIPVTKASFSNNQLIMSFSDIILSVQKILSNKLFERKYNKIFYEMNNAEGVGSNFKDGEYIFNSRNFGQSLNIRVNLTGSKLVLVVANYPNKKLKNVEIVDRLFPLLK